MSANLDRIDLNSDAVSVESENDAMGPNPSEPTARVELPDAKTLAEASQVLEVGELGGGRGADGSCAKGFERKTEVVGEGIGIYLDGKIGSLDGGQDSTSGSSKVEQNGSSRVEWEVEEASCAGGISNSLSGYASQVQNACCSGSSLGVVNVEVKAAYGNDFLPHSVVHSGVLQDKDINMSNELNLVVDLKSFRTADAGDMNAKTAFSEQEFRVSDLIWGKVWSHPWWPGQIFDPSAASKKAKKYFKRGRHLIAYFGDQTFAWNEDSMIKPFQMHFAQMEKQSDSEDFIYAIDCALDELSRRVELGLACPCVPEYSKINSQIIVNAGIREDYNRKDDSDSFSSATSFEPHALIEFIKALSQQSPFGRVERLEIVTAQAQLLAFNRWKGYSDLPQIQMLGALLESDEEISLLPEMKHGNGLNENFATKDKIDGQVSSEKDQGSSSRKRKHNSGDSGHPSKKEKSLAELMLEKRSSLSNGKHGLDSKAIVKSISSSGRKRKVVDSASDESAAKRSKSPPAVGKNSLQPKKTYRVGDSILRATQLSGLTPILKSVSATSQKLAAKNQGRHSKSQGKKLFSVEDSSTDEMVSYLCLVARNPTKAWSSLNLMVNFFTTFRDSVCLDSLSSQQHKESSLEHVISSDLEKESAKLETESSVLEHGINNGDLEKKSAKLEAVTSVLEHMPAMAIQSITNGPSSLENENESGESPTETPIEKANPTVGPESAAQSGGNLDIDHLPASEALDLGALKPVSPLKESGHGDLSPTALILKFTDVGSIPSETNLNKIFSRFGHLKESETEVLKKSSRVKVVFCRRADAEAAFSSAGKYSIFGPSLVSYRLKYMPSSPSNCSKSTKQIKKVATSCEGTAT